LDAGDGIKSSASVAHDLAVFGCDARGKRGQWRCEPARTESESVDRRDQADQPVAECHPGVPGPLLVVAPADGFHRPDGESGRISHALRGGERLRELLYKVAPFTKSLGGRRNPLPLARAITLEEARWPDIGRRTHPLWRVDADPRHMVRALSVGLRPARWGAVGINAVPREFSTKRRGAQEFSVGLFAQIGKTPLRFGAASRWRMVARFLGVL